MFLNIAQLELRSQGLLKPANTRYPNNVNTQHNKDDKWSMRPVAIPGHISLVDEDGKLDDLVTMIQAALIEGSKKAKGLVLNESPTAKECYTNFGMYLHFVVENGGIYRFLGEYWNITYLCCILLYCWLLVAFVSCSCSAALNIQKMYIATLLLY